LAEFDTRYENSAEPPKQQNISELTELKQKFLSSAKIHSIVKDSFGARVASDHASVPQCYNSAEETLTDINRLLLLEDFDGLKRRIM